MSCPINFSYSAVTWVVLTSVEMSRAMHLQVIPFISYPINIKQNKLFVKNETDILL